MHGSIEILSVRELHKEGNKTMRNVVDAILIGIIIRLLPIWILDNLFQGVLVIVISAVFSYILIQKIERRFHEKY